MLTLTSARTILQFGCQSVFGIGNVLPLPSRDNGTCWILQEDCSRTPRHAANFDLPPMTIVSARPVLVLQRRVPAWQRPQVSGFLAILKSLLFLDGELTASDMLHAILTRSSSNMVYKDKRKMLELRI